METFALNSGRGLRRDSSVGLADWSSTDSKTNTNTNNTTTNKQNTNNHNTRANYDGCFTKTAGKTITDLWSEQTSTQTMHNLLAPPNQYSHYNASNHNVSRKQPYQAIFQLTSETKTKDTASSNVLWAPRMKKKTKSRIRVDPEGEKEIYIEREQRKETVLQIEDIAPMDGMTMTMDVDSDEDQEMMTQYGRDDGDHDDKDDEEDNGIFMALVFDDDEENDSEEEKEDTESVTERIAKVLTF